MECPKCGTIGLLPEQLGARTCKTCRHSKTISRPTWEGCVQCHHPRICVCTPDEDFFCSEWEGRDHSRSGTPQRRHVTDEELAPTMKAVEGMRKKDRSEFTERSP